MMLCNGFALRPAALLIAVEITRRYVRGTHTLIPDQDGVALISYADFGVAMVDLIEDAALHQQRLTVGYQTKAASA